LDMMLLIELTGEPFDFSFVFDGSISSMMNELQDEAKSSKDLALLQSSYVFRVLIEYWRGNYSAAEEYSRIASMMLPQSKMPTIYLIYHTLFRGLILLHLSREQDVEDKRLDGGIEAMDQMGRWAKNATEAFENKWLLLRAEHAATVKNHDEALRLYKASIQASQDHGNIHECALGHELLGNYYLGLGCSSDSIASFEQACVFYTQWGATAQAGRLIRKHSLGIDAATERDCQGRKNARQWDETII